MDNLSFIEKDQKSIKEFIEKCIVQYSKNKSESLLKPYSITYEESKKSYYKVFVNGKLEEGHNIFNVVEKERNQVIGEVWLYHDENKTFIYELIIFEEFQGRGYGTKTLKKIESYFKNRGAKKIGLNVFGDNLVAINLYKKAGYRVGNMNMVKPLND
ncbi:GNAT family N-acetyltransferase [Ferdinandcohnia sp. SAFN-114]|uniref:GNAT family N-acetyltransferase n=1 Tax=Ferdinandcohnia sp. SAFN-114 TaxID=3387275 RepID=UPI003F7CDE94